MPKASYRKPVEEFAFLILIFMVAAFVPYFHVVLVNPLKEKELKLKELLRIAGTSDIAYLLSWIITYAVIMLVAVLILNVITILGNIFSNSNYIVIVIICYLYGLSIITMSLMLTPFFKSVTIADLFASLLTTILAAITILLVFFEVSKCGEVVIVTLFTNSICSCLVWGRLMLFSFSFITPSLFANWMHLKNYKAVKTHT